MEKEKNMLKKTIKYTDFNGVERTEDFYFNLSKAELMEMEMSTSGGLTEMVKRIINTQDTPSILRIFKKIILKAYGVKSDDGKRFIKNEDLAKEFEQTEAYSELFMELLQDEKKAADFINGLLPKDLAKQIEDEQAKQNLLNVI